LFKIKNASQNIYTNAMFNVLLIIILVLPILLLNNLEGFRGSSPFPPQCIAGYSSGYFFHSREFGYGIEAVVIRLN
jgi:hypothetical protein